mgnify:CR=1 FL=1
MKIWLSYSALCHQLQRGNHPEPDDRFYFGCKSEIIGRDPYYPYDLNTTYSALAKKYYDAAEYKMCAGDLRDNDSEMPIWRALAKISGKEEEFLTTLGDYDSWYNYPRAQEILSKIGIDSVR